MSMHPISFPDAEPALTRHLCPPGMLVQLVAPIPGEYIPARHFMHAPPL